LHRGNEGVCSGIAPRTEGVSASMKMKQRTLTIIISVMMLTVLAFTFSACGNDAIKIEDYEWKMRTVMSNDMELEDSAGVVLAVGEKDEMYPDAKIVDLTLVAKDGKLTITDATNNKSYEGTYKATKATPKGTDYEVTIDGKEGFATVAMTEYYEGDDEPTLPINLGDYSIYFYPASSFSSVGGADGPSDVEVNP